MIINFDYTAFLFFYALLVGLGWFAYQFSDLNPSQKRLINVESMLKQHIEDAKGTIQTMKNIDKSNHEIINILKSK